MLTQCSVFASFFSLAFYLLFLRNGECIDKIRMHRQSDNHSANKNLKIYFTQCNADRKRQNKKFWIFKIEVFNLHNKKHSVRTTFIRLNELNNKLLGIGPIKSRLDYSLSHSFFALLLFYFKKRNLNVSELTMMIYVFRKRTKQTESFHSTKAMIAFV